LSVVSREGLRWLELGVQAGARSVLELAWNKSRAVSVNQINKPTDIGGDPVETT
jgi:hypothetical protein